jgi:hypothetical protein
MYINLFSVLIYLTFNSYKAESNFVSQKVEVQKTKYSIEFPSDFHPKLNANNTLWDSNTGTVTIISNVSFSDGDEDVKGFHWIIPDIVKKIKINKNVTITGGFRVGHTMEISGDNPLNSRLYGTDLYDWAEGRIPDSLKRNNGAINELAGGSDITITLKNLKIENSRNFAVSFRNNNKVIASRIYIVNNRAKIKPDYASNSDGFVMGRGSVIDDCYIDTWDDAFKLFYNNQIIKNTTIIHNRNGYPFALGYASVERVEALLSNIKVKNGGLGGTVNTDGNQCLFGGVNGTSSCDSHITLDNVSVPDYTNILIKDGLGGRIAMPFVRFKSPNAKVIFYGKNPKLSFSGKSQTALVAPPGAVCNVNNICDNSGLKEMDKNYSCANATGCSWKD